MSNRQSLEADLRAARWDLRDAERQLNLTFASDTRNKIKAHITALNERIQEINRTLELLK